MRSGRQFRVDPPPADRSSAAPLAPGQIPNSLTRLVGRDAELDQLLLLLHCADVRLVTLTGPPGIGKTRLGFAAARRWHEETGQRVRFVPLSVISDPALVAPSIARVFSIQSDSGMSSINQLQQALVREPTLILLDNFEQIVEAASLLTELLMLAPELKLLVTSRAGLQSPGEHEWSVPPLALPALVGSEPLTGLAQVPSVELLLERAIAADRTFALTKANADVITAICVRLEGVPLAIELAATWFKLFTPGMLLARLQQAPVLSDEAVAPGRQRTLHDAIAWSEALLAPEERDIFRRLALFSGGWTLEAVQELCRLGDGERSIEEMMHSLVNKSLITRHTLSGDDGRYRMLAMIRAYALEQLDRSEFGESAHDRHAAFFEALAASASGQLIDERQAEWLDRLELEHGNFRAALRWLIDAGFRTRAMALAVNLEFFWILHDHLFEAQRWLDEIMQMPDTVDAALDAAARGVLAAILLRQGAYERARELVQQNVAYADSSGNLALAAQSLHALGIIASFAGETVRSEHLFQLSLTIARDVGDQRTVARVLSHLGGLSRYRGDDDAAHRYYTESLVIWRSIGVPERIAMMLHNMAPVIARQGKLSEALDLIGESLDQFWELGNMHGVALSLMAIAGMVRRTGTQAVMASQLFGAADALRSSIGVEWNPDDRAEQQRSSESIARLLDEASFMAAVAQGRLIPIDTAVRQARSLLKSMATAGQPVRSRLVVGQLTKREYEIVLQIALGRTNREIANLLSISEKTVEMHVGHSLSKLGFRSRAQLAAWAVESSTPSISAGTR